MIGTKKAQQKTSNTKYCSDRCRNRKPGALDRKIEQTIVSLLNGQENSGIEKTAADSKTVKGDKRVIVTMLEIEEIMFGSRFDPAKTFGRRRNRASRAIGGDGDTWQSVDMEDKPEIPERIEFQRQYSRGDPLVRPPQDHSEVNGSIGGEKGLAEREDETEEAFSKREDGNKKAIEREMVRRAARRGVVFGFEVEPKDAADAGYSSKSKSKSQRKKKESPEPETEETQLHTRRKCEALMRGQLVEPSFAKGNWEIRWRE